MAQERRSVWKRRTLPVSLNTSLLTLANVQSGDSGDYDVVISNSVGVVTSAVARLTFVRSLDSDPPVVSSISPAAGATVSTWGQVMVGFSEPVSVVQPWDLLIDNILRLQSRTQATRISSQRLSPRRAPRPCGSIRTTGYTDMAGNRLNENGTSDSWSYFIVDAAPPLAGIVYPAPGAVVSRSDSVQVAS